MKMNTHWGLIILILATVFVTPGCSPFEPSPSVLEVTAALDECARAKAALIAFFDRLSEGNFDEAADLYSGSIDLLMTYNPEVDAHNRAALLEAACMTNGFLCLRVRKALLQEQISPSECRFVVEFMNEDGSLFVRESCCGAEEAEEPPATQFTYSVAKNTEGNFLVQDLPVYVP